MSNSIDGYAVPRSALLFLAIVEEAKNTTDGPFRAIAPLFRIALEPQRGQIFDVSKAASVLQPTLGESFNHHTVEAFLPQLEALNWVKRQNLNDREAAYIVPSSLPDFDTEKALESSAKKLSRLFDAYREYLERTVPLLNVGLNSQEFQWQIFKWATSLDGSDKDAIQRYALDLIDGAKPAATKNYLDETQKFSHFRTGLSVEFAGFVKWLVLQKRPEFLDIASLTELGLALEFLQELRSPTSRHETRTQTSFVLDAPVLLDLFGMSGSSRQGSIARCVSILRDKGAKIVTLDHCLAEMAEILKTVLGRTDRENLDLLAIF